MHCPNCHAQCEEDARMCWSCGCRLNGSIPNTAFVLAFAATVVVLLALPFGICGVIGIVGYAANPSQEYSFIGLFAGMVAIIPILAAILFIVMARRLKARFPYDSRKPLWT